MARIMTVLIFVLALNLAIPVVNKVSPFSVYYTSAPVAGLGSSQILAAGGCNTYTNGSISCSAGVGTGGSSSGILGSIVNTIFVFGYFIAASNFIVQIAVGILAPGQYIFMWLYALFGDAGTSLAVAGVFSAVVYFVYAGGIIYYISGRDILGWTS